MLSVPTSATGLVAAAGAAAAKKTAASGIVDARAAAPAFQKLRCYSKFMVSGIVAVRHQAGRQTGKQLARCYIPGGFVLCSRLIRTALKGQPNYTVQQQQCVCVVIFHTCLHATSALSAAFNSLWRAESTGAQPLTSTLIRFKIIQKVIQM